MPLRSRPPARPARATPRGPTPPPACDTRRPLTATLVAIGALTVVLHVLGATLFRDQWWGVHSYAFLPFWAIPVSGVVVVAAAWRLLDRGRGVDPGDAPPAPLDRSSRGAGVPIRLWLAFAAAFMLIAWLARVRHLFLGDGVPLTQELPRGTLFHPRQPLTYLLQHLLFTQLGPLFSGPGILPTRVAQMTSAVGAVVCGGLFALVACALAFELFANDAGGRGEPDRALPLAAAGIFLVQGFDLLFFGYVENYTFYAVALAFYVLSAIKYLRGRWGLWVPVVAAGSATALHLSGAVVVPSLLFLLGCAPGLRVERRRLILDSAIGVGIVLSLAILLRCFAPGYNWLSTVWIAGRGAIRGVGGTGSGYMFSTVHFRDFLNEQWLIGPLALFFFLASVAVTMVTRQRWNRERIFLLVTGMSYGFACWVAGDSNLGYARNWDLLAPAGIVFLAGGLFFFCAPPAAPARRGRLLAMALALSLFQFVPWVAINSSERLGVERVKALPLGGGRPEVMLGSWFLGQGRLPEAREWYNRAIVAYSGSHVAHDRLGYICLLEKKYDEAAQEYLQASRLKADWPAYQENAVNALILVG